MTAMTLRFTIIPSHVRVLGRDLYQGWARHSVAEGRSAGSAWYKAVRHHRQTHTYRQNDRQTEKVGGKGASFLTHCLPHLAWYHHTRSQYRTRRTPRNQIQETAFFVQFVPGMWFLVLDFGVQHYTPYAVSHRRRRAEDRQHGTGHGVGDQ
eukprot:1856175-Rhodomonas_salina.2